MRPGGHEPLAELAQPDRQPSGYCRLHRRVRPRVGRAEVLRVGGSQVAMNIDKELDVRGLNCPMPILKAKKLLGELASGQTLRVVATDPGSLRDFQAFAKQTGHELVSQTHDNVEFVHVLKKK
jgi:tRNA 2-thiouridine synthesizing protein A